jgi:hypothetical protein
MEFAKNAKPRIPRGFAQKIPRHMYNTYKVCAFGVVYVSNFDD